MNLRLIPFQAVGLASVSLFGPDEACPSYVRVVDLGVGLHRLDKPGTVTIKLAYVPESGRLEVKLAHDEPAGGLAARLMNLPGLPPVSLDLDGRGTLDAWNATLDFKAGDRIEVVERTQSTEDWWTGRINGRQGVFPGACTLI